MFTLAELITHIGRRRLAVAKATSFSWGIVWNDGKFSYCYGTKQLAEAEIYRARYKRVDPKFGRIVKVKVMEVK